MRWGDEVKEPDFHHIGFLFAQYDHKDKAKLAEMRKSQEEIVGARNTDLMPHLM